jgi:hypothetical protein
LRYSSTLSLTLALDGGGWSTPRPGRFTPETYTRYLLCRRLGGPQGRSGRLRKTSPPPGLDPRTVQPVASRYTDYAIPAPHFIRNKMPLSESGMTRDSVCEKLCRITLFRINSKILNLKLGDIRAHVVLG